MVPSDVSELIRPRPARTPSRASGALADLISFALLAVPLIGAVWMISTGGGYTVNEWGWWAAMTALALAVAIVGLDRPPLHPLQRVAIGSMVVLSLFSLLSLRWSPYPQSALVEAGRYLFYACAVALAVVVLNGYGMRRVAAGLVAGVAGVLALLLAWGMWTSGVGGPTFDQGRLVGSIGYAGGMAATVAFAVAPLVAFASDRRTVPAMRIASGAGAGAAAALVIPTGSRGALFGVVVGVTVMIGLSPTPVRCALVAAPAALAIAVQWDTLNGAFGVNVGRAQIEPVGRAVLLTALVTAIGALTQALADGWFEFDDRRRRAVGVASAVLLAICTLAALAGGIAAIGNPLAWTEDRWREFRTESSPFRGEQDSRFTVVGSGRYDLWRVSVSTFREHPLRGSGAGSFLQVYEREGRSGDQPFQAHSQPLEVAATLGLPGLVTYILAVGVPLAAAVITRLRAKLRSERLLAAGIAGGLVEFLVHSSIDWTWHIGAAALPPLFLGAVALASLPRHEGAPAPALVRLLVPAVAVSLGTALLVLPATFAQANLLSSYRMPARQAIEEARRAQRFDRLSSRPDVAMARAHLRIGDAAAALASARRATEKEPEFWVGWQLRYLAAQLVGAEEEAGVALARARRLNPSLRLDLRFVAPPVSYDHY